MKKITFLIFLFVSSLGFSQELLTDGDFESGAAAPNWTGNGAGANVADDGSGSNFVNAALVGAAAEGWQTSLQQVVPMTQGQAYALSFDAYVDAGTATMKAGIGQNGGAFSSAGTDATETLTTTSTNFSYTFTPGYDTVGNGARVFFDMGGTANDGITIFIDNVSLMETTAAPSCTDGIMNGDETGVDCGGSCPNSCPTAPMTAAPTPPARAAADVISIYGESYGTAIGLNNVPWDTPTEFSEIMIAGNPTLQIDFDQFMGSSLGTVVDATGMTHFHLDYFIGDEFVAGQVFNQKLSNHTGGAGETNAGELTIALPGDGTLNQQWVSLDVPLTDFSAGISPREAITEYLITVAGLINTAYIDNLYFHKNTVLSTDNFETAEFRAFPNPTKGDWNITGSTVISNISVFDILGKQVVTLTPNATEVSIDASSLNSGIYFARIEGDNGSKTVKLIKE